MNHSSFANSVADREPWHIDVRTCDKCGHVGPLVLRRINLKGKPLWCNRCFQQRGSATLAYMVSMLAFLVLGMLIMRTIAPSEPQPVDHLEYQITPFDIDVESAPC
jgi:hypothetical protein